MKSNAAHKEEAEFGHERPLGTIEPTLYDFSFKTVIFFVLGEFFKTCSLFTAMPGVCPASDYFLSKSVKRYDEYLRLFSFNYLNLLFYPFVVMVTTFISALILSSGLQLIAMNADMTVSMLTYGFFSVIAAVITLALTSTINYDGTLDTWDALRCFPKDPYMVMKDPHVGALSVIYGGMTILLHTMLYAYVFATKSMPYIPEFKWELESFAMFLNSSVNCALTLSIIAALSRILTQVIAHDVIFHNKVPFTKLILLDKISNNVGFRLRGIMSQDQSLHSTGLLYVSPMMCFLFAGAIQTAISVSITPYMYGINWSEITSHSALTTVTASLPYLLNLICISTLGGSLMYMLWLRPKYKYLNFVNGDILGFSAIYMEIGILLLVCTML